MFGQLGNGTTPNRNAPTVIPGFSGVLGLSATNYATCAALADTSVRCWGQFVGSPVFFPGPAFPELSDVVALHGGNNHVCARLGGGGVRCWGNNTNGELGIGLITVSTETVPLTVPGLSGVGKLAVGYQHTCAVLPTGSVRCWGDNTGGQLGDGTSTQRTAPASAIPGLSGVIEIAAGRAHTCAVLSDGSVRCWGDNASGQLGDGTTTRRLSPTPVPDLSNVTALAAGQYHTCALLAGGSVRCWGANTYGEVGDGTKVRRPLPVEVAFDGEVIELAAHSFANRTCARLADHSVRCWGRNQYGEIGDRTTTDRLTPTPVIW